MVLLLTDVFLLLTQVLLWLVVGLVVWFVLLRALPRAFLGMLVLLLILIVLALSFFNGPPRDGGVLEIIWRIISFPFSPLGLAIIFLLILLSGTKLTKFARNAILIGLVLLSLGSFPFVAYFLAQELEMEGIELIQSFPNLASGGRRVIVLMGQGTTRPSLRGRREAVPTQKSNASVKVERPVSEEAFQVLSQLPIQLTEHGDRLIYAAQLYDQESKANTNPVIVVTAGNRRDRIQKDGEKREEVSETRDIQTFLTSTLNVPETAILLDHESSTVHKSAENVQQLLKDQGVDLGGQLTIVTSGMLMNRTALTFGQVFDSTTINARPTDFYTLPPSKNLALLLKGRDLVERQLQATDFLPSAEALYVSSQAIDEYISSFYYFLRGWIKPFRVTVPVPASTETSPSSEVRERSAPEQESPAPTTPASTPAPTPTESPTAPPSPSPPPGQSGSSQGAPLYRPRSR